jgi:hypothetical protein
MRINLQHKLLVSLIAIGIAMPFSAGAYDTYFSEFDDPNDAVNNDYESRTPCRDLEGDEPRASDEYDSSISEEGTSAGGPGGNYVPVKDFEQEALQEQTNELIRETNDRLINSNSLTRPQTVYLRILCEKAMVEDRALQHQWQQVIGDFVNNITGWINTAYNGTPMYVTNPHVYYRQVDIGVVNAMEQEVEEAAENGLIDDDEAFQIRKMLARARASKAWGSNTIADWTTRDPAAKAVFENRDRFSFNAMYEGVSNPRNNVQNKFRTVRQELRQRQKAARDVEQQKLQWGEGYFSWEECGQDVFSGNPVDIRTCRILTPGSTIQDLSTRVFATALRQMQEADEYKEWVSQTAVSVLGSTMSVNGLNNVGDPLGDDGFSPDPVGPSRATDRVFHYEQINNDEMRWNFNEKPKAKIDAYLNQL